jgi:hypothetical protein
LLNIFATGAYVYGCANKLLLVYGNKLLVLDVELKIGLFGVVLLQAFRNVGN